MGKLVHGLAVIASLSLLACQPMYGEKADTLKSPKSKDKKGTDAPPPPPEVYVDSCTFNSQIPVTPQNTQRNTTAAKPLVTAGDKKVETAVKDPSENARVSIYQKSLADYADALKRDPYSAEATLGLARAYHGLHQKRCAIMLIQRLAELTRNAKYATDAQKAISEIKAHSDWFQPYRQEVDRELP